MLRYLLPLALVVGMLLLAADPALGCPTCKVAAQNSSAGDPATGYQYSILLMAGMPFLILGTLGGLFYWQIRSARVGGEPFGPDQWQPPARP